MLRADTTVNSYISLTSKNYRLNFLKKWLSQEIHSEHKIVKHQYFLKKSMQYFNHEYISKKTVINKKDCQPHFFVKIKKKTSKAKSWNIG